MRKLLKILLIILIVIICLLSILFISSYIYHKNTSKKELKVLEQYNTGEVIRINNKDVNYKIFNEDNKNATIVFMGGSGVNDLTLSLEPLAEKINAKIVLINRPGYGRSSDVKDKATIQYIVEYYRKTLKELEIDEQVILMPHSISGMYAMYWASMYPTEVKSILGLDIGSPYLYLNDEVDSSLGLLYFASKIGLHRQTWLLNMIGYETAIINYDTYSDDYFNAIKIMNNLNPMSKFNVSEEKLIIKNAEEAINAINDKYMNKKKLFIISSSVSGEFYDKYVRDNAKKHFKSDKKLNQYIEYVNESNDKIRKSLLIDENTEFVYIEGPHCMYYYLSDKLIDEINAFI